jgi:hypothetical protein
MKWIEGEGYILPSGRICGLGEAAMTELERARAFLRKAQSNLAMMRRTSCCLSDHDSAEAPVLAALSWVWEEQNRTDGDYVFPMAAGNPDLGYEWQ